MIIHKYKTLFFEWVSIFQKRKFYKNIKWTDEETKEFNDYWEKYYGKRISPRWHKLYQSMNGVHDIKYFPEILYSTKLELELNPFNRAKFLEDKGLIEILFDGNSLVKDKSIKIPKTIIVSSNGYYYDSNREIISYIEMLDILSNVGEVVIKPTIGGSSGKGVRVLNLSESIDKKTNTTLENILKQYGFDFIVQEKIVQSDKLASLHKYSINTLRVITYICESQIYHLPICLRMGANKSEVDNIHSGGMVIGISDKGYLKKYAYRLGYGDNDEKLTEHPNSKIQFEGHFIDGIDKVIKVAYKLHSRLPGIGIISWDFTIDNNETPVVIEANLTGQSIWFPQIIHSQNAFGSNMNKILSIIKK